MNKYAVYKHTFYIGKVQQYTQCKGLDDELQPFLHPTASWLDKMQSGRKATDKRAVV